jgi:Zn finger protein HypA/HybF involved in hydrogenase expression
MTSLIDQLLAHPGEPPTEVRIQAGPTFTPEALTQAYEILTMGMHLEGSRMVVEPTGEEATCKSCHKRWTVSAENCLGALCVCPFCGAPGPVPRTPHVELIGTS